MEKIVVEEEKKFYPAKNQKSIDSESYQMSVSQSQSEQRNEEEPIPVLVKKKHKHKKAKRMKEKVEEEKELPPIFKRQRYDVEPEVSAFDDEANTNFNTFLFN